MRKNNKYTGEFKEMVVRKYREDPTSLHRETRGRKRLSLKYDKSREELLQEQVDYLKMENAILKKWVQLIKENN